MRRYSCVQWILKSSIMSAFRKGEIWETHILKTIAGPVYSVLRECLDDFIEKVEGTPLEQGPGKGI